MYLIRQAVADDAATLHKLARMVQSNNLPADTAQLRAKINRLRKCFSGDIEVGREFMFALEDTETGNVIGSSSIIADVGAEGRPHLYLKVRRREHYSEDLKTGQVHMTLQLESDETGPSEIGGLVLSPAYRGHAQRLGSLLSLIRFHFMGLHRDWFSQRVIAEMMGSVTPEQRNGLWDFLGRRFINLSYADADRFSRESKEFITSLFPNGEIYASLLPPEVRKLIGAVGPEAEPARRMLVRLGFTDPGHIDPFDGGPYLEAALDDISLVTETTWTTLGDPADDYPLLGFVSMTGPRGFRAIRSPYVEQGDQIALPPDAAGLLGAQVGDTIGLTPLGDATPPVADAATTQKAGT